MVWSGKYVWIASLDGGLTRVANPGPHAEYRSYTSNLGSMQLPAVTGAIIGSSEWVYYGMYDGGLGRIVEHFKAQRLPVPGNTRIHIAH